MNPEKSLLDIHDVAAKLDVSIRTVKRMIVDGQLPAPGKLRNFNRWSRVILDEWIAKGIPPIELSVPKRRIRGRIMA